MKPITEAEQISSVAFGFMASKALFVALHMGLFSRLAGRALSAEDLAAEAGVPVNRVLTVLTALTTTGLVTCSDGLYANSPGADTFLVQGAPLDFGDYLRFQVDRQMFGFMQQLESVVTGDEAGIKVDSYEQWMSDEAEARLYSESQHAGSLGPGRTLGRRVDLSRVPHLLDVAEGTGGMAIRLCEANPELAVTILDFPNVIALGEEKVAEAGLSERIRFLGGNALSTAWPEPVDAVLMSYLLSGVPGESIPSLFPYAFRVMNPGGVFMVHDFMVDDDRQGPQLAALWQLQHLAFTPDAESLTPGALIEGMSAAGFTAIEVFDMIPGMTRVVVGQKPEGV